MKKFLLILLVTLSFSSFMHSAAAQIVHSQKNGIGPSAMRPKDLLVPSGCNTVYFNITTIPGVWVQIPWAQNGYAPGCYAEFWDYTSGDTLQFPDGSTLVVGPSGYDVNCYVGGTCPSQVKAPGCTLSLVPAVALPGANITLSGTNFSSTNNTVQLTGDGSNVITLSSLPSPNTTTIVFTIPTSAILGNYTVTVPTQNQCNSMALRVGDSQAPSNLTATISNTTGQVTLNWQDNTTNEISFNIETTDRLGNFGGNGFVVGPNMSTYTYTLGSNEPLVPNKSYRIRAMLPGSVFTGYSNTAKLSTCVLISGDSTAPNKVVFVRGQSWNVAPNIFLAQANDVINNGFAVLDPFKTYLSQFSFYEDLVPFADSGGDPSPTEALSEVKARSSCGSTAEQYIAYVNGTLTPYSITGMGVSVINLNPLTTKVEGFASAHQAIVAMHEVGHAFGGLFDEYIIETWGNNNPLLGSSWISGPLISTENCSSKPSWDFRGFDNKIYGAVINTGCGYLLLNNSSDPRHPNMYYRPSTYSIMAKTDTNTLVQDRFNVVSCGFIIAAINHMPLSYSSARQFWPQCKTLNTIQDGIPAMNPTPTIASISKTVLSPGDPTITGTRFAPTDNSIILTNTTDSSIVYEFTGIPSPDGKIISFTIPANAVSGTYTLKAGAFNSAWSAPITVTITGPLNVAGMSCSVMPSNNGDYGSAGGYGGYSFTGYPNGGTAPYSYILNSVPFAAPGSGSVNGVNVLNYMPGGVWTPNFVFSLRNGAYTAGAYLTVTSADQKTGKVMCTPGHPTPTATLTANADAYSSGANIGLSWNASNVTSCTGSTNPEVNATTFETSLPTSGSTNASATKSTTFILTCSGPNGTVTASKTISVAPPSNPKMPIQAPIQEVQPDIQTSYIPWSMAAAVEEFWNTFTHAFGR